MGTARRDCFCFFRADGGAKSGLEGPSCSLLLRVRAVPNDAKMHANLAGQYVHCNQLDLAAREFQIALRINPDSPDALASYSALEFQRGNYQAAGAMMEKALSLSGRNNLDYDFMVVTYAAILMKTNQPDEALENLNREITESPLYAPGWSTRAELHYQQGELAAARAPTPQAALSRSLPDDSARAGCCCGGWMLLQSPHLGQHAEDSMTTAESRLTREDSFMRISAPATRPLRRWPGWR